MSWALWQCDLFFPLHVHMCVCDMMVLLQAHLIVLVLQRTLIFFSIIFGAFLPSLTFHFIIFFFPYKGDVIYSAEGFVEKNKDTLFQDLKRLMYSSVIPVHKTVRNLKPLIRCYASSRCAHL